MHPYCCLHSIRRNFCKIFLTFYILQKVIFVMTLTTLRSLIRTKSSFMGYLVNIANQCINSKYYFLGFCIMIFINLILLCGNIEENPGPKTKPNNNLSLCHWNVNSIPSHYFQKIAVLEIFVAMKDLI